MILCKNENYDTFVETFSMMLEKLLQFADEISIWAHTSCKVDNEIKYSLVVGN